MVSYSPELAARYRERGYWIGQTHTAMLESAAAAHPDAVAVVDRRRSLTYARLLADSRSLAHGLLRRGLRPGDRVVVQLPNVSEFLETVFALFDAGLVPVFALASHGTAEVDDLVTRSRASAYVTADSTPATDFSAIAAAVAAHHPELIVITVPLTGRRPDVGTSFDDLRTDTHASTGSSSGPEELAFLQLSGGTTGAPKLIGRTHDDYLYSVRESARICGLTAESVFGVVLPVSHNFTMSSPGVLGAVYAGATVVMIESQDAETVFRTVARHGVTQLSAVPPLVTAWIDSPSRTAHDISSLTVLQVGGAKLSRSVAERVPAAFGVTLQQVFGMAEGLVNYTRLDDDLETIVGTQGRPISPDDEIRLIGPDGTEVPDGRPGSLQVRGPYTIPQYWEGMAAESFTPDGFYCTGDVVVRDTRGYLRVVGRDKDQINRAGEKVAPEEVENHLLAHPSVRDASVVGVDDDRLGERIVAYVIPSSVSQSAVDDPDRDTGLTSTTLRGFLRERGLARFKYPDEIHLVDDFPTTAVGKISKNAQRDSAPTTPAADPTDDEVEPRSRILIDIADKLDTRVDDLDRGASLIDVGVDSLALMALIDTWRADGAVDIDFETILAAESLDEVADAVLAARAN